MELLYGTNNPAKLANMRENLQGLDIGLLGLMDMPGPLPEAPEDGTTPLENAGQKALCYYAAFRRPVFSCDSGLYIENLPERLQPGVHVRNVGGRRLNDSEMIEYYSGLARRFGPLRARYWNAVCLVLDEERSFVSMEESLASQPFLIVDTPHPTQARVEGFPLDCLSVEPRSGRYYYDLHQKGAYAGEENGFRRFFSAHLWR